MPVEKEQIMVNHFTKLMDENMDFACHIANQFLPDQEAVQDCVQNAFIKAWKSFVKYDETQSRFSTWFYSILKNECIDWQRKNQKIHLVSLDGIQLAEEDEGSHPPETVRLIRQLLRMADQLPLKQKETFLLRDIEGYSIREVIEITQQTEGSVKTNLYLARKTLREWTKKGEKHE